MKKLFLILLVILVCILFGCELEEDTGPDHPPYRLAIIFSVSDVAEVVDDKLVITEAKGMMITYKVGNEPIETIYISDTFYCYETWIAEGTLISARNQPDPIETNACLAASVDGISIGGSNKPGEVSRTWHFHSDYVFGD